MSNSENLYIELFETRGDKYANAMKQYPSARDEEFLQALKKVDVKSGMCVADVPAGGKYLQKFLPENTIYFPYEPCQSFYLNDINKNVTDTLLPLPFDDGTVDVVFSIAGVHHIEDKTELFKDIKRVLSQGGTFVLSDVASSSDVAKFLDGFMGEHNSTGHKGYFLDDDTISQLQNAGLKVKSKSIEKYHWVFDSEDDMAIFCNMLFDMCHSTTQKTKQALKDELGVEKLPDGKVGLKWELMSVVSY